MAPLDDFRISHGICPSCRENRVISDSEVLRRGGEVREFFCDISSAALSGRSISFDDVIGRGRAQGIKDTDILMGIVQPVLYQVGEAFARGSLRIATEHAFTMFCEDLLQSLSANEYVAPIIKDPGRSENLLVCADDNYHSLSVRFLNFFLMKKKIDRFAIYPGLPAEEVIELIRLCRPRLLGISIAMPEQISYLNEVALSMKELDHDYWPEKIIVGGFVFRSNDPIKLPSGFVRAPTNYDELMKVFAN